MKGTGIVRRIDDLGRIVIPKEIRRTLMINEGDPLELYVQDDMIFFRKYVPSKNYVAVLNSVITTINDDDDVKNRHEVANRLKELVLLLETDAV